MNEPLYNFEFHGKRQPGISPEKLKSGLIRLFNCTEQEVAPLVNGEAKFVREGLNAFTAKAYQDYFQKIGAVGRVIEQVETKNAEPDQPKPIHSDQPQCPKCHSVNINQDSCLDCGIYFEKYRQYQAKQQAKKAVVEAEIEQPSEKPQDDNSRLAAKWLSIAALLLTAAFTLDGYLQNLRFLNHVGFDMGGLPFVFGHLFLIRGMVYFARTKGYSGILGGLGFFSLIGLSILLLLPNKNAPEKKQGFKTLATAISCLVISGFWVQGYMAKKAWTAQRLDLSQNTLQGAHQYPSKILDTEEDIQKGFQSTKTFVQQTLSELQKSGLRPDDISLVANAAFQSITEYEVWVNYQRYLHTKMQVELPPSITTKGLENSRKTLSAILQTFLATHTQERVNEAYQQWQYGLDPDQDRSAAFWIDVNRKLNVIVDQVNSARMTHLNELARQHQKIDKAWLPDLRQLPLPRIKNVTIKLERDTVTLKSAMGPLSVHPLTLGLYQLPYKNRDKTTGYLLTFAQISNGFPNRYLTGYLNVFNRYGTGS